MYRAKRKLDKVVLYDDLEPGSTKIMDRLVLLGRRGLANHRARRHALAPAAGWTCTRGSSALRPCALAACALRAGGARRLHPCHRGAPKLIWPFTLATVDAVLRHIKRLGAGLCAGPTLRSMSQRASCKASDLVDALLERLRAADVDPSRLVIELTETALISNAGQTRSVLDRLASHGVDLAIDGFGAGFTSFGCLRDFRVR